MSPPRIVIVGAGPAGSRAATTLVGAGLRPVVIDEARRSGGQIYRRPPPGFVRSAKELYGFEAGKARRAHRAFDEIAGAIDYRPDCLVWNLWEGAAHLHGPEGETAIPFDAIVLATGAIDRVIPFPGWTTPGVFTLGGAQIALKYQACAIGRRVAFLGTGPLLYLVAHQYAAHGAEVAAVLDTARLGDGLRALPDLLPSGGTLAKGLYYRARLRTRGIALEGGVAPLALEGGERVRALRYRDRAGRERSLACDALAFGYGLKSETQLADLLGCDFRFDAPSRQWLPETDADGRASVKGVYLAGDGAGIAGADAAELRGELAALALIADHGMTAPGARIARLRRRLARLQRFRRGLERAFPFPHHLAHAMADEVLLCRCEATSAGAFRAAALELGASEVNRAKAFSRVGMGRCQGRVCGPAAAEVLARALGLEIADVGRLRGQPPIKPLPIARALP